MNRYFIFFILALALGACNQEKPANNQQPATDTPPASATPMPALPSVSLELLEKIWQEGTQVDYIFYNYPFTMSLTDKPSIQYAVRHVAEGTATLKPECKAAGRVTYQIKGEIVLEGDFYFSTGCTYFVFEKNRQKTNANLMTDEGITYFNNQIQQALKMQEQMQQPAGQ